MTHFTKLLKESKLVGTLDTKLEQVYTTYNGYLNKTRDYGIKRSLPNKTSVKTPWIRIKSIDTPYRHNDYRSASSETSLVNLWNQLQVGIKSSRKNHAPINNSNNNTSSSDVHPIRLEFSKFHIGSNRISKTSNLGLSSFESSTTSSNNKSTLERGRIKPIWNMYQDEFEKFLRVLRTKRLEFKKFLDDRETLRKKNSLNFVSSPNEIPKVDIDLYEYAQGNPDQIRRDIEEFFEKMKEETRVREDDTKILPMPHPNLGLNYGHFDLLHNERLTPTIDGRILDQADIKSSRQTVSIGGIVASLQRSSHMDLPSTSFEPDQNGYHNIDQGKGKFRIESVSIDPYDLPTQDQFQGFNNINNQYSNDQPVKWSDPRDKPRALGTNRIKLHVREAHFADNSNRINRFNQIGSFDWVANPPPKRQGPIVLDFLSSITNNLRPPPSSNSNNTPNNNNNNNRSSQNQNDQLMKVLKDLVGKPK